MVVLDLHVCLCNKIYRFENICKVPTMAWRISEHFLISATGLMVLQQFFCILSRLNM